MGGSEMGWGRVDRIEGRINGNRCRRVRGFHHSLYLLKIAKTLRYAHLIRDTAGTLQRKQLPPPSFLGHKLLCSLLFLPQTFHGSSTIWAVCPFSHKFLADHWMTPPMLRVYVS